MFPCKTCSKLFPRTELIRRGYYGKARIQRFSCRPCDKAQTKRYRSTKNGKEKLRLAALRFREKERVRLMLRRAVADGLIRKPTVCQFGCESAIIQGHHADYSKPYDVQWLCPRHHAIAHHPIKLPIKK